MGVFEGFSPWSHRRFRALLSPYLDSRLDEVQVRRLEQHLRTCAPCQGEMRTLRDTVGLLRSLPRAVPRRSFTLTERPAALPPAPAYLWGLRGATSVAAIALMLLFAGDFLGIFSRDVTPVPEITLQATAEGVTDISTDAKDQESLRSDFTATPSLQTEDVAMASLAAEEMEEQEVLPTTALEVALGGLVAVLAVATLFLSWRFRQRGVGV